jgi:uridine kinase
MERCALFLPYRRLRESLVENLRIERLPVTGALDLISSSVALDRTFLVGIDGGAGAGKTTFAHWFAGVIHASSTPVSIVHIDNFCRPSSEREDKNAVVSDLDWKRLRDRVLNPLQTGESALFQLYDWPADRLKDWVTINVGGVTIVDGVTATRRELSGYYDLRIWLSCPRDIRASRLLGRGDTPEAEIKRWLPSEDRYIASHNPEERAHLTIDTTAGISAHDGSGWFVKRWSPPTLSTATRSRL